MPADEIFKAKCIETWMLEEMLDMLLTPLQSSSSTRITLDDKNSKNWKACAIERLLSRFVTPLGIQILSKRTRENLKCR